jgi:hypothetical protein
MTFSTGAKITADILEEIINGLIDTNMWHNVDTTWTTTNRTANNARRVVAYGNIGTTASTTIGSAVIAGSLTIPVVDVTNFATDMKIIIGSGSTCETRVITGVAPGMLTVGAAINTNHAIGERVMNIALETYLSIEVINTQYNFYYGNQGWWYYGKGFRIVFSKTWNAATHTFPTTNPGTDYQSTFLPFEVQRDSVPSELATLMVTYFLWYENNGFVLMGKPEPSSTNTQQSFIVVIERLPTKEYVDEFTNFYCFTTGNAWQYQALYDGNWPPTEWRYRGVLRPFAYQYPAHTSWGGYTINGNGISFSPMPSYYGYKSIGNGKVYYIKPIIHDQANQLAPIFQSELFFMWSEGQGLIDGDVVAVQGQPVKFLCKALDSPDSANRLTFAIKYFG